MLAFACFEYWMGDLECAASTSVLSGFFICSGALLFAVRRRQRARLSGLADHDAAHRNRPLSHDVPSPDVVPSAPWVANSELSDAERSKSSDNYGEVEHVTDFGALGKRADVRKLIEKLRNQMPRQQK